jgi:hypothetical protein
VSSVLFGTLNNLTYKARNNVGQKYVKVDFLIRAGTINRSFLAHIIHTRSSIRPVAQSPRRPFTQSPVQLGEVLFHRGCVTRTTHLHLVPRLRMTGTVCFTYPFLCLLTSATFEFIIAVLFRFALFWDMKPCRLVVGQSLG